MHPFALGTEYLFHDIAHAALTACKVTDIGAYLLDFWSGISWTAWAAAELHDFVVRHIVAHVDDFLRTKTVELHPFLEALQFEAIHRLVYDVDNDKLISELTDALGLSETEISDQYVICSCGGSEKKLYINKKSSNLSVGSLQNFLDAYLKANGGKIDYIHGSDTVKNLAEKHSGIAFILPDMNKSELFPTVIKDGALPRKTFSMGHAEDKRFYIEARKITE